MARPSSLVSRALLCPAPAAQPRSPPRRDGEAQGRPATPAGRERRGRRASPVRRRRVGRRRVRACTITSPARGNCGGRGENGAKISSRTAGFVTRSHYAQGQQSHSPIGSIAATVRVDFEAKISVWNDNGQCLLSVSSYALRDNLSPGSESSSDSRENRRPPHAHHTARAARAVLPLPPLPATVRRWRPCHPPSACASHLPLLRPFLSYRCCQPPADTAAASHGPMLPPLFDTVRHRCRFPTPSAAAAAVRHHPPACIRVRASPRPAPHPPPPAPSQRPPTATAAPTPSCALPTRAAPAAPAAHISVVSAVGPSLSGGGGKRLRVLR